MGSEFSDIIAVDRWLQQWWGRAGGIVTNYDDSTPEDPWAWDAWLAWGVVELPGTVGGESMQPLIEFLQGIVALWDSRAETGPKRTHNELQNLSSRAWVTYNRLQTLIWKIQEAAGESGAGAGAAADCVDSDYSEARAKSEWAAILGLDPDKGLRRKIKQGKLRTLPGTKPAARNIRLHIDDLPNHLKSNHQRNQKAEDVKRTTGGQ